jgi:hypothetical protein
MELVEKVLLGTATKEDVYDELYEICDRVHASCDDDCPIHRINGGVLKDGSSYEKLYGCGCFKNGEKMAAFLVENSR